ncbi:unnamed protein product [Spirodela intermedia]|uniref:Uncharacterized protein n=1 Tax=Spirodela intermedia TaxID=51605 RepID=A0A7I8LGL2_SPIIN|nr:unnamed protein product [Spirodela intermedia]
MEQEETSSTREHGTPDKMIADDAGWVSSRSKNSEDEEYLLPEFDELVRQGLMSVDLYTENLETPPDDGSPVDAEKLTEQEILKLRTLVDVLQERVACLEVQLLEYYGLKDQRSTVRELENHLKSKDMEARLLSLKMNSVQAENEKLGVRASEYRGVNAQLESARAEMMHLEGILRSDLTLEKEKMTALHHRIAAVQGNDDDETVDKRLKEWEDEAADLRKANLNLAMENASLSKKLESTQILASSTLDSPEKIQALEEVRRLKQINDELVNEIGQIQIDRCADIEELVYLRWVNACLRYELRNYQPSPGKTAARDLSHTLSPDSEQKAKQLIHEFANSGDNGKFIKIDFDPEHYPSLGASSLTENRELDESSVHSSFASKSNASSKTQLLRKLKRLLMGKHKHQDRNSSVDRSPTGLERRASTSAYSFDGNTGRHSYDSLASSISSDYGQENQLTATEGNFHEQPQKGGPWNKKLSRVSLDFQRLKKQGESSKLDGERSRSDLAVSYWQAMAIRDDNLLHTGAVEDETLETTYERPRRRHRSASVSLF